ncbi:MAG: ComF family protein [bacterium]|nr:ComF family protein [bacterium]
MYGWHRYNVISYGIHATKGIPVLSSRHTGVWLYGITEIRNMLDFNRVIRTIGGLLYPTSCAGCGAFDVELCETCKNLFQTPHTEQIEQSLDVIWFANFKNPSVKKIIKAFKFQNQRNLAKLLEPIIKPHAPKTDLVVPIPLHSTKLLKRGYNQAELIAEQCGTPTRALVRIKETPPQGHADSREARFANLCGAFAVIDPIIIKDKTILLVDDVMTTGATLSSATLELKKAGAKEVAALVLAHG